MAERSFVEEVKKLRLAEGEVFRGEGILAVTKALLESGVAYVAGYQGSPISHLMDVLADAQDILAEYGIRFENSASEATAAATLAASVNYPLRGAVTFKATVGTNVASDALANLASGGVTGGALIIVGEDYGEGSSIMQERSHAFAMKSQIWLLDPRPNLPCIVKAVKQGFALSEASHTPVMLQLRIRACHVHGHFVAADNQRPAFSVADALDKPQRDVNRIVLPPASFLHEQEKVHDRWPAALAYIRENGLNEFFSDEAADIGIVVQGGTYNTLMRVLERLGLADVYGNAQLPIYVMNVAYPLVDDEVLRFCRGKRAVLMVEEGQPNFIEQGIATILRQHGLDCVLHGKDMLPMAGEYSAQVLMAGLKRFFAQYPMLVPASSVNAAEGVSGNLSAAMSGVGAGVGAMSAAVEEGRSNAASGVASEAARMMIGDDAVGPLGPKGKRQAPARVIPILPTETLRPLAESVHARPPGFCTGCPERPIFSAMKLLEREIGPQHVSADIGCHLFSILPPFNLGNTTMGYGLGSAGSAALNVSGGKRAISMMGDGGFWHNGLTSGVANAVFNRSDNLIIIVDNSYTSATGGQDILSSKAQNPSRSTGHAIEQAVRGVGVQWVRTIGRTYDVSAMRDAMKEALTTPQKGPKVIIAQSECMLNRQRREKPIVRQALAAGQRVVREKFGVDHDTCTGDHSCIRLSGCPSLSIKTHPDPLRTDPVATVLDSCVGCGHCGDVSHAAVLCPSFYRARVVQHPGLWERLRAGVRHWVIGRLQAVEARRRARVAF
ncbi:MAG: indolepyruvate ferredoxin oxidoreductase subunit alpha [Lautropia sp.]|nr:indolepyruvate ferredoxin oxidoreductase subunit alpha [Lautropia sp.]